MRIESEGWLVSKEALHHGSPQRHPRTEATAPALLQLVRIELHHPFEQFLLVGGTDACSAVYHTQVQGAEHVVHPTHRARVVVVGAVRGGT